MLQIIPVSGPQVVLTSRDLSDRRFKSGHSRVTGLEGDAAVTFYFERFLRGRLEELRPLIGENVTQTVNRAGLVQLMSTKPCAFVRCEWDHALTKGYSHGAEPDPRGRSSMTGVLSVSEARFEGFKEGLALTLFRGDWLWQGGAVVRFP